jgi:hypothetical protein
VIGEHELTPGMLAFRRDLDALLQQYVHDVGPEFGGIDPEGIEMVAPMPVGWVLVTDWEDADAVDPELRSSIVSVTSGIRLSQKIGLLTIALDLAEDD